MRARAPQRLWNRIQEKVLGLLLFRQVTRVRRSQLFDPAHYLAANPDVRQSGLDPALHYVLVGANELLDPSPGLYARMLLTQVPAFRVGVDNPILFLEDHYIARGRTLPDLHGRTPLSITLLLEKLRATDTAEDDIGPQTVDIIVPVHNNADKLQQLLVSLKAHTSERHTIILIDDGSTEQEIPRLLKGFSRDRKNVELITNPENLGFAASVNKGLQRSTNHKILLNSDTVVPDGWVDRLVAPILRDPMTASVTPFSNTSTYTGFPENRIDLPLPSPADMARNNDALSLFVACDRELTCGVGFCMAINSSALEMVGPLDETTFRNGYYEDTDWCYRAKKAGFRNVLANRLFVGHDHTSSSFGIARKLAALAISEAAMRAKHPDYFAKMDAFYLADPHQDLRRQSELVAACHNAEKTIAIFEDGNANSFRATIRQLKHRAATSRVCILHITQASGAIHIAVESPHLATKLTGSGMSDVLELMEQLRVRTLVTDTALRSGETAPLTEQLLKHCQAHKCEVFSADDLTSMPLLTAPLTHSRSPCIGVIAPAPDQRGWEKVFTLVKHIQETKRPCRVVVFGDIPDDKITSAEVSKTGIYRLENIPALIRHHDVDMIYYPSIRTHIFACTYRQMMAMGLPIVTHGSKPASSQAEAYERWTIAPDTPVDRIYASLEMSARTLQEMSEPALIPDH